MNSLAEVITEQSCDYFIIIMLLLKIEVTLAKHTRKSKGKFPRIKKSGHPTLAHQMLIDCYFFH